MTPEGQTERLLLRPISLEDAPQVQAIFPQWEIVRYFAARIAWPFPPDGVRRFYESMMPLIEQGDAWIWSLRLKSDSGRIIGGLDLHRGEDHNRRFWLSPVWQGRGLMTEACVWTNDFWFETLGFSRLRESKASANIASRRISERLGMRLIGTAESDYVCGRLPREIWEQTSEEWLARKRQNSFPL